MKALPIDRKGFVISLIQNAQVKYPKWFPYPSSWLNSILLGFLMTGTVYVSREILKSSFEAAVQTQSLQILITGCAIALLSPIPLIALTHHFVHKMIAVVAPKLHETDLLGNLKGWSPGLMSWWEGLWSWATMLFSLIVMCWVGFLIAPSYDIEITQQSMTGDVDRFTAILSFVWLTTAACLYQVAYLVEQRIRRRTDRAT